MQVRNLVLSGVDKGLAAAKSSLRNEFGGERFEVTRATQADGKSPVLKVKWSGREFRLNIIPTISSDYVNNLYVAKKYTLP